MTPSDQPDSEPAIQLPAVLPPGASNMEVAALHAMIPTLIADAGDQAAWRYVDFFTANIRNPNTAGPTPGRAAHFSTGVKHGAASSERSGPSMSVHI
jgi:hypothetical protein